MKKMLKLLFIGVVSVTLFLGSAAATPIFNANPYADFGSGVEGLPDNPEGPGYYIWANNESRTSWSVRWTGRDWTETDSYSNYEWKGSITFSNSEGIDDAVKILWENDGTLSIIDLGGSDMVTFGEAIAGPHWDGFDFTLTGVVGDYLTFNLYSSFFDLSNDGIYIGQEMLSVLENSDNPELFRSGTGTNRQFEIAAPVPEPGTMILFGIGLMGIAGVTRRKIKK